jgi:hypothetical protein
MSAFLRCLGELTFFSLAAVYATGQSIPLNPSPQNSGKPTIRFQRLPLAFESNYRLGTDTSQQPHPLLIIALGWFIYPQEIEPFVLRNETGT